MHRLDAARVFRLALESAQAGRSLHAVAEEGVPVRADRRGGRPRPRRCRWTSIRRTPEHFGWLGRFLAADAPASSAYTRELLGWQPTQLGLIEDLVHYTSAAVAVEAQSASPSIGRAK